MVLIVGHVHTPLSRRQMALFVVHIFRARSSCVMPAAVRAATRSATRTCNVRSRARARERLFSGAPFVRTARLRARIPEGSYTICRRALAPMVSKTANSHRRPCPSSVRMNLRPNTGICARIYGRCRAGIEPMQFGARSSVESCLRRALQGPIAAWPASTAARYAADGSSHFC
jgi:hypothetical protein